MKLKLVLGALVCALSLSAFTMLGSASAQTTAPSINCSTPSCLTQTITGTTADGQSYDLTSTVTGFQNQRGSLLADVTTTGTVGGSRITPMNSTVPVTQLAHDPCTILNLTLGPLHLNLLGLVVDLNQVHLKITGQTGPGNLLGNLLCGVANALNGGHGGGIATLLNHLLAGL